MDSLRRRKHRARVQIRFVRNKKVEASLIYKGSEYQLVSARLAGNAIQATYIRKDFSHASRR